jgi:hypothetical protein
VLGAAENLEHLHERTLKGTQSQTADTLGQGFAAAKHKLSWRVTVWEQRELPVDDDSVPGQKYARRAIQSPFRYRKNQISVRKVETDQIEACSSSREPRTFYSESFHRGTPPIPRRYGRYHCRHRTANSWGTTWPLSTTILHRKNARKDEQSLVTLPEREFRGPCTKEGSVSAE